MKSSLLIELANRSFAHSDSFRKNAVLADIVAICSNRFEVIQVNVKWQSLLWHTFQSWPEQVVLKLLIFFAVFFISWCLTLCGKKKLTKRTSGATKRFVFDWFMILYLCW